MTYTKPPERVRLTHLPSLDGIATVYDIGVSRTADEMRIITRGREMQDDFVNAHIIDLPQLRFLLRDISALPSSVDERIGSAHATRAFLNSMLQEVSKWETTHDTQ